MQATVKAGMVTLDYHEPSVNEDNITALIDLDHTSIYVNGVKLKDVPASSLNGGGAITETFDSGVQKGQEKSLSITVSAWDGSGNESPHSSALTVRVDMLAPASPF